MSESSTAKKKKMSLKNKILVGGAGVALAAIAGTGIGFGMSSNNGKKAPEATSSSAPANPTPEASTPETPPTTQEVGFDTSIGLSVDIYTTPEALSEAALNELETSWLNDGATPENTAEVYSIKTNLSAEDFSTKIAAETDQDYIDALFISNWQANPALVSIAGKFSANHQSTLELYYRTSNYSGTQADDIEPYRREVKLLSVESSTENADGSWTIITTEKETDNGDKNRSDELTGHSGPKEFETPIKVRRLWVVEDGKWKVSQVESLGSA